MQITALAQLVVGRIFEDFRRSGASNRTRLVRSLRLSGQELEAALSELELLGLVNRRQFRLTFDGLVIAASLSAKRRSRSGEKVPSPQIERSNVIPFRRRAVPRRELALCAGRRG